MYDTPLLSAVGHPVAVNPDPRMLLMALSRRWPVLHLDVPPGVPKLPLLDLEPQQVALAFTRPSTVPVRPVGHRRASSTSPPPGPVILVANHRSYFDALAMTLVIARSGRTARFLGKKEVFDVPVVGQLAKAMGGIRVERASGSDEPLRFAAEALEAGQMVALMPQGTIPRGPSFFDPELKGRWGAARLAADDQGARSCRSACGARRRCGPAPPACPASGTSRTRRWSARGSGAPVELKYRSPDADTKRIMKAIVDLLPPEARQPHEPTEEELRLTYPPGYKGDPAAEDGTARRRARDLIERVRLAPVHGCTT